MYSASAKEVKSYNLQVGVLQSLQNLNILLLHVFTPFYVCIHCAGPGFAELSESHLTNFNDHLGHWSPKKDCCCLLSFRQPVRKPSAESSD